MTQDQAFLIMKTGVNVYLTGSAGSGKTYLLNKYIKYLNDNNINVAVTASTGIAATHMNGMTIHSWSGLGIKNILTENDLDQLEEKKYLWKRYEKTKVLIIDEISMLSGSQLEMIERISRRFKRNDKPFGGIQIILSGDFFQLPPVFKDNNNKLIFEDNTWSLLNPAICYIEEQHRQEDDNLVEILNKIRNNNLEQRHYDSLEKRVGQKIDNELKRTKLYTHNINVDNINDIELSKIAQEEIRFKMKESGSQILVEILKKSCLANEELKLKIDSEVMFIKNNFEEGYVNGSRGKIIGFQNDSNNPIVKLYNNKIINTKEELWVIEEDGKIKASISQIPLRLAWAITIHKSQGMSLDNAEIDLSNTFGYGMGYVALSRVRTLEGISLVGFDKKSILVDPKILKFDQYLKDSSKQNNILFKKLSKEEQYKLEQDFIIKSGGSIVKLPKNEKKSETILITKDLLEEGKNINEISKIRKLTKQTIINHLSKIIIKYPKIKIDHIKPNKKDINLVKKLINKLSILDRDKLTPLKNLLEKEGSNLTFEEIQIIKLFL